MHEDKLDGRIIPGQLDRKSKDTRSKQQAPHAMINEHQGYGMDLRAGLNLMRLTSLWNRAANWKALRTAPRELSMEHPEDWTDQDRLAERGRLLEAENRRLRDLLAACGIAHSKTLSKPGRAARPAGRALSTTEEIMHFRSLFRGREDVFAQRGESPDGKSGYSAGTERDWKG